jgi:TPR repeat protein
MHAGCPDCLSGIVLLAGALLYVAGAAHAGEIQVPNVSESKTPPSIIILGPSGTVVDPKMAALTAKARAGDHDAQAELGAKMLDAKPPKFDEAFKWFQLAADGGNAEAAYRLGVMLTIGQGRPKDAVEAAKWCRVAADRGHAPAQVLLGKAYETGSGVPQDFAEALKWYRMSADQKNAVAQVNLASMYSNGRGVARDPAEATRLYRLAADQGDSVGQGNLGLRYAAGQGIAPNPAAAYFWLNLSAARMPATMAALRSQVVLTRDNAAARLAAPELERVQKMAAAWKPGSTDVPPEIPLGQAAPLAQAVPPPRAAVPLPPVAPPRLVTPPLQPRPAGLPPAPAGTP